MAAPDSVFELVEWFDRNRAAYLVNDLKGSGHLPAVDFWATILLLARYFSGDKLAELLASRTAAICEVGHKHQEQEHPTTAH